MQIDDMNNIGLSSDVQLGEIHKGKLWETYLALQM